MAVSNASMWPRHCKIDGIAAIFTHADVPGQNMFGPVFHDEELLAKEECHHVGQPIVVLAGTSRDALQAAKALVRIDMETLPAVLTIDEAIAKKQFIGSPKRIQCGNVAAAFAEAEHTFWRAPSRAAARSISTWSPSRPLPFRVKRGRSPFTLRRRIRRKSRPSWPAAWDCDRIRLSVNAGAWAAASAARKRKALIRRSWRPSSRSKTRRPARAGSHLRPGHGQTTGKRHPYQSHYRVAFNNDGQITGLKVDFYSNGGFSADLSLAVMERTLFHADNAYYIPHAEFTGTVCRTNLPSNTAFRGFGGPQGVAVIENIIEEIAVHLGLDAYEVRRRNLYGIKERNVTPYGQVVTPNLLPALLDRLEETAQYKERLAEIEAFNASPASRAQIKGISLIPVKFGISFTKTMLNQGSALVNIYLDGTIQVSTGGTEMGQGLNVKIRQLVADQFDLPAESVLLMPTSTEKNNNTSPTAASASTDLNGTAAVMACEALRQRLADVAARHFASEVAS